MRSVPSSRELLATLLRHEVKSVRRLQQKRKVGWRRGKQNDYHSRLMQWYKPARPTKSGITREEWWALPDTLPIRLVGVRAKGCELKSRTIYIATILTVTEYPTEEIAMR